jgi:hypothetical protein
VCRNLQALRKDEDATFDSVMATVRRAYERDVQSAKRPRVLCVEELVELSQEDLLKMQENTAVALQRKMEESNKCSVCMERNKVSLFPG